MAPSTPPPPSIRSLAALTMASTARPVMLPKIISIRALTPSRTGEGRRTGRRSAMPRRALVRVGKLDQQGLAPGAPQQLDADRQAIGRESAGHDDRRQAGVGAEVAVGPGLRLAGDVGLAADRRIGERVEPMVGHRLEDRLSQRVALDDVLEVFLGVSRVDALRRAQPRLERRMEFP